MESGNRELWDGAARGLDDSAGVLKLRDTFKSPGELTKEKSMPGPVPGQ